MPLTDTSKSKVSLGSLSSTTAAAAESLWSRKAKRSSKKSTTSADGSVIAPSSEISAGSSRSGSATPSVGTISIPQQQQLEQQEFRRKFLEGLQFYCENSSLILNSDLPADLIEFVTSHGFSVESLGIILELKKSSSAFTEYVEKKPDGDPNSVLGVKAAPSQRSREQNFSEISRRLLQHWMSADSCAEAFVSLSLGEEIPGLIAECASFQRVLFAVPDNFHLAAKDFLSYLLSQISLSIFTLTYGIRVASEEGTQETLKVRTNVLATFLDRIFMRYYSDEAYFYSSTYKPNGDESEGSNPFEIFVSKLAEFCENDVIGRRLVTKTFLQVSSHSASKLTKTLFKSSYNNASQNLGSLFLYPSLEFLETSPHWKFVLRSFPIKTITKSKRFWINWSTFIEMESRCCEEFWKECVNHWVVLNKSVLVDERSLFSATLALAALARQIKSKRISEKNQEREWKFDAGEILQNIIHSLESINEEKRACGMALGQIVSDMQLCQSSEDRQSLQFDCKSKVFLEIIDFYEHGIPGNAADLEKCQKVKEEPSRSQPVQVLDSDDDIEEEDLQSQREESDGFPVLREGDHSSAQSDVPVDPRILSLRSSKKKIPMYFSEVVETLLEGSKDDSERAILQYIVVLKIPVLLCTGVRIDAKMASTICRCLADMEDGGNVELPVLFSLYELFLQHPFELADVLGNIVFDRNHYALGQRLMNLTRLIHIVRLSSKQSCFGCYLKVLGKHKNEMLGIYPEFIGKYYEPRRKLRICTECRGSMNVTPNTTESEQQLERTVETSEVLTWRQIVDKRVAAKTRYFVTPKGKTLVAVPDEYSSKLFPILWASAANRLTSAAGFYLDNDERIRSGKMHDIFIITVFQFLARCVLGSSGSQCPHIRNVASHAGELVANFIHHEDAIVRRTVLSLLGVILSVGEGKVFIIESLSSRGNLLMNIEIFLDVEKDEENRKFLTQIQQFLFQSTTAGVLSDLNNQTSPTY